MWKGLGFPSEVREASPKVREGWGCPVGLGGVGRPPKGLEGSKSPFEGPGKIGRLPGGQGGVRRPPGVPEGIGKPPRRFGRGQEATS